VSDIQSHYDAINAWCIDTAKALTAEFNRDIERVQVTISPSFSAWVTVFVRYRSTCISRSGKTVKEAYNLCRKELWVDHARQPDLAAILGLTP